MHEAVKSALENGYRFPLARAHVHTPPARWLLALWVLWAQASQLRR